MDLFLVLPPALPLLSWYLYKGIGCFLHIVLFKEKEQQTRAWEVGEGIAQEETL